MGHHTRSVSRYGQPGRPRRMLHLRSASLVGSFELSQVQVSVTRQALSRIQAQCQVTTRERSGLSPKSPFALCRCYSVTTLLFAGAFVPAVKSALPMLVARERRVARTEPEITTAQSTFWIKDVVPIRATRLWKKVLIARSPAPFQKSLVIIICSPPGQFSRTVDLRTRGS